MNLNQLRVFHAVAAELSFSRAADRLHLTQPGISKHVRELEEQYGTRLFDRLGRKVMLTQAGEVLFQTTGEMFSLLDAAAARIGDLQGLKGGNLRLGASLSIGTYLLPSLLVRFRQRYPAVTVKADVIGCRQVVEKVLAGELEIGLVSVSTLDRGLVAQPFADDRMVLILSPAHPWAQRSVPVGPPELAEQPFLLAKAGSGTRLMVEAWFRQAGVGLRHAIELGSTEGVKKAVEANMGIAIVSAQVIATELGAGTLTTVPLTTSLRREFSLVYHKDRYLSASAQAFQALLPSTVSHGPTGFACLDGTP